MAHTKWLFHLNNTISIINSEVEWRKHQLHKSILNKQFCCGKQFFLSSVIFPGYLALYLTQIRCSTNICLMVKSLLILRWNRGSPRFLNCSWYGFLSPVLSLCQSLYSVRSPNSGQYLNYFLTIMCLGGLPFLGWLEFY